MAIGQIVEFHGGTQQQYDALLRELNLGGKLTAGHIFHMAGPMEGGWRVVNMWESREAFDKFYNDKLQSAWQKVGLPQPQMLFFPIHNMLWERSKQAGS